MANDFYKSDYIVLNLGKNKATHSPLNCTVKYTGYNFTIYLNLIYL